MRVRVLAVIMGMLFGFAPDARADLILATVGIDAEIGLWRWTYFLEIGPTQELRTGSMFTVYDFDGYVAGGETAPSADWAFTASPTGLTPTSGADGDDPVPPDSPTIPNLTWEYTGTTTITSDKDPQNQEVGEFSALSMFGFEGSVLGWYAGLGYVEGSSPGTLVFNSEQEVLVPRNPVPEPGSMLLLGTGLFGAAAMVRRRRKARAVA